MSTPSVPQPKFNFPKPARQIYIHHFLERSRNTVLHGAVVAAAARVEAKKLREEITKYVPEAGLKAAQQGKVRDELVFATPSILRAAPMTLGYYRLLLGVSQKQFYHKNTNLAGFKSMEEAGTIRANAEAGIEALCIELNQAISGLVAQLPSVGLVSDIDQLPLMTLGAQADGSWRTRIGQEATKLVFQALKNVVQAKGVAIQDHGESFSLTNSSGRLVTLALAPDPDVVIKEVVNGQTVFKVAIEIKGGTDYSNVHNRAGEAEKSHRKAHAGRAQDFWTVIALSGADLTVLAGESPTTRQFFDLEEVLAQAGPSWDRLVALTLSAAGI